MHKKWFAGACAAAAATLCVPASVAAQETEASPAAQSELALARQIVELGYPVEQREELFFGAMDQMTAQMRQSALANMPAPDPGATAILDRWLANYLSGAKDTLRQHMPAIMDGITRSYASLFTETELRDILAFVSTPSGQSFFVQSSQILSQPAFAEANQAYMADVLAELPAARAALVKELMEYQAARPAEGE